MMPEWHSESHCIVQNNYLQFLPEQLIFCNYQASQGMDPNTKKQGDRVWAGCMQPERIHTAHANANHPFLLLTTSTIFLADLGTCWEEHRAWSSSEITQSSACCFTAFVLLYLSTVVRPRCLFYYTATCYKYTQSQRFSDRSFCLSWRTHTYSSSDVSTKELPENINQCSVKTGILFSLIQSSNF